MSDALKIIRTGMIWNLGSFCVLALCGIGLNILIARVYPTAVLGVFNQVFAVYIIVSQFAAGGLYFSTLQLAAVAGKPEAAGRCAGAALLLAAVLAGATTVCLYLLAVPVGRVLNSAPVAVGLLLVVPGIWVFALNKVLLAALNAMEHLRAYAVLQALRYIVLAATVGLIALAGGPGWTLPLAFSVAEAVVFVTALWFLLVGFGVSLRPASSEDLRAWLGRHLRFAARAFPAALLLDANTRVDVLMLGYFMADRGVGIYSFAAMLAEGFAQIPLVVMVSVNARLAHLIAGRQWDALRALILMVRRRMWAAMALVGAAAVAAYPLVTRLVTANPDLPTGTTVFAVLMTGVVVSSGYAPFQMILNQAHRPGAYTLFMSAFVATNVLLNAVLIPRAGILGAAMATAAASVMMIVFLKLFVRRSLGVSIL